MVRGKPSSEVREMCNITFNQPREDLNTSNALEGQAGTAPTTGDANNEGPSPQPDPMNQ